MTTAHFSLIEYWIEGIGSTCRIFNGGILSAPVIDVPFPQLLCFQNNSTIIYHHPDFTTCYADYPVALFDVSSDDALKIYPNPVKNFIQIENSNTIQSYKVFAASGQVILMANVNSNSVNIPLSNLSNGIYILQIITPENITNRIIVKK